MTDAQIDAPAVVVVNRWTRYGKDRAYAAVGGRQLGYRDLHTGAVVCELSADEPVVEHTTDELWRAARAKRYAPRHASAPEPTAPELTAREPTAPEATAPARRPASPRPPLQPDRDLRAHRPGQAVRAQAQALRDEAPVRTLVERFLGMKTEERAWRIGGQAEEAVAQRLASLGPGWRVLHAIPVGERGSDIDHLVVGPAGVFTINAKHHPQANVWVRGETVKVNGTTVPYVRNSRFEAARAAELLSARAGFDVEVRALIAVMGAERGFKVVEQPRGGVVTVVQRKRVADHLRGLPVVLGTPSIERIHDVARHLATWQPKTVAWSDAI